MEKKETKGKGKAREENAVASSSKLIKGKFSFLYFANFINTSLVSSGRPAFVGKPPLSVIADSVISMDGRARKPIVVARLEVVREKLAIAQDSLELAKSVVEALEAKEAELVALL